MIEFECPGCGTVLAVKNRRKRAVCEFCRTVIEPEDIEPLDDLRPRRRWSPFHRAWRVRAWGILAAAAIVSLVLVLVAIAAPHRHQIAVWYGVGEAVLAGLLMGWIWCIEQDRDPVSPTFAMAGPMGVFLYYSVRWPQPALMLVLGLATMIGAVAFERPGGAPPPGADTPGRPAPPAPKPTPLPDRPSPEPPRPAPAALAGAKQPFDLDPAAKAAGRRLYLVALTPFDYQRGPWKYAVGATGLDAEAPIKVQDRVFPYGISACPPNSLKESCRVSFVPGGEFRRLRGGCALNDYWSPAAGKIVFAVWGDGRKLWQSAPLDQDSRSAVFDVDVSKVKVLTLEARVAEGSHLHCHGVWLDPWLER